VTCPRLRYLFVTGAPGDKPTQLVVPSVWTVAGSRGKTSLSQSGKTCSWLMEAPDAPSQKMHKVRPRRNGGLFGIYSPMREAYRSAVATN